tara:strand:+ start:192 stop:629 length:438 start_codon:yes stop_codon:yes gene_type:complete
MKTFKEIREGKPPGLYANIHAKRKRGERPRKPGAKGAPALDAFDKINNSVEEKKKLTGQDAKGHKRPTEKGAGLTQKGVDAYNRKTGGNLKTAVTTEPSKLKPGSKAAKRRKSYCARSAGQMKMFPKAAKDPNSRLRQARRRWNC